MNKTLAVLLGLAAAGVPACAQPAAIPSAPPVPAMASGSQPDAITHYDEAQLDQLLGPIALYPDALIALILPASTVSTDVVLAARSVRENPGASAQIETTTWDGSVKSLAHYPDVLRWMDENLAWTQQLGGAFTAQPADVMNTVQRLRARARAAGTLVDTPQQQVIGEPGAISIVPTQPNIIYVPYYDPVVVYQQQPAYYTDSYFRFSPGYPTGLWLAYNLDWNQRRVWVVNRPDRDRYWRDHSSSWHRPSPPPRNDPVRRPWTPPPPSRVVTRPIPPPSGLSPIRPGAYTPPRRDDARLRDSDRDGRPDILRPAPPIRDQSPTRPRIDPRQPHPDFVKPAPLTPRMSTPWPERNPGRFGDRPPRANPDVPLPSVAPATVAPPAPEPASQSPANSSFSPAPQNQPPLSPPSSRESDRDRAYGTRRDR